MAESRLRRVGALALAVAVLCGALTLGAPHAQAHTQHEGSQTLFEGTSGPYGLLVTAVPLVGYLEVTVVFAPGVPDAPLPYNPRVAVLALRDGESLGPVAAVRRPSTPANEYAAVLTPGEPGEWEVVIRIDGEPGSTTLTLPVAIGRGRGFPWAALAAGLGIVLPILWLVFVPRRKPRSGPRG